MTTHQLDILWEIFGWVAAILNVVGNITIATKSKVGWIIRIVVNVLWFPYGVYTKAWALIANHALFVVINAWGWWKWNRDEKRELRIVTPGETPPTSAFQKARRQAYVNGFNAGRLAERRAGRIR
ncbi:MAG TPA: nicotinamide mononucleotide transporter [Vicinamibacterales bacterium]|nr:nicotinamide mononucleotide transporter [Vicinamibacterales bacterium]